MADGAIPADVDAYIAAASAKAQPVLHEMRRIIRTALPDAEEIISYQIPTYRQAGMVVSFGDARRHVGLYAISHALTKLHARELSAYDSSGRGTIRFPLGEPLPEKLIAALVKGRLAENQAKAASKRKR